MSLFDKLTYIVPPAATLLADYEAVEGEKPLDPMS